MDIRDIYKTYRALEDDKMPKKTTVKEASMNISMNGQNAAEVAELVGILKNAGMPNAGPVADMHVDMPMAHDAMHTDIDSHNDSPCGMGEDEVEEDERYQASTSPDEEYKDDNFMIHDMGDDLHRKKDRRAIRTVDPALESTLKSELRQALKDKLS